MSQAKNARGTGLIFVGQAVVQAIPTTNGNRLTLTGGPSMARYQGWVLARLVVDHRNLDVSATTTVQLHSADNTPLCDTFDPISQTKIIAAYQRKLAAGDVAGAWKLFVTDTSGMALVSGKMDVYAELIRPRS